MERNVDTNADCRSPMQFSPQSILLCFVVLWTAAAALGTAWGIAATVGLLGTAAYFRTVRFMSRTARRTWWILASLFVVTCGVADFAVGFYFINYPSPMSISLNRLHMVLLGLRGYEQKNGCFPPAFVVNPTGKHKLSWRTLLLPYIEEGALYDQYNQNEPWDGPANSKLPAPHEFCWSNYPWSETRMTCLAVDGKNTGWGEGKTWKPSDLPDGGKHTIILVAVADSDVKWCEPRDLTVDEAIDVIQAGPLRRDSGYFYYDQPGVTIVGFGDGRVAWLPAHTRRDVLESLLTTSDKASALDIDQIIASAGARPSPALRWDRIGYISLLVASYLLLLLRRDRIKGTSAYVDKAAQVE
jgi:hypothetical protein